MTVESIGIIGYGHFGQFVHELAGQFFPELTVRIHSRHIGEKDDTFVSMQAACSCDVVILCGAISEYEEQIKIVTELAPEHSIIVDVATVKGFSSVLLRKHAGNRKFLSTHPMFGPESFKKHQGDVSGFRIVVTDYALGNDEAVQMKNVFAQLGFVVVEMTADEHDKRLANSLFLTHYLARSITRASFGRTNMDTLSFQFLMDAVESVAHDERLFQDVYRFNPYCKEAVDRLHASLDEVYAELRKSNEHHDLSHV